MSNKIINTRITQKHDTQENWDKAVNFIPMAGEIIVYDADTENVRPRIKVGDGVNSVSALPFEGETVDVADVIEICGGSELVAASEVKF